MGIVKFMWNNKEITVKEIDQNILVVRNITEETLKIAQLGKFKLFECKDNEEECLQMVTRLLLKIPKSCKFS
ncbi:hypothetical protein CM19_05095 [Candidatus Acidianus copahuensis]|uniref:Uncharacterized protein n=1 Tax=Candidatus Acidianus copahuensis TaxID=1160895 RepID=A0A031LPS8_9CREN|nr:hypothetical protein [Candidatus Acidianus copahuensis]EZQ07092.1 hypothetical protein CM19_05095 [Candidatus Acidianus copahuensis]